MKPIAATQTRTTDHPHVRALALCPVCMTNPKDVGALVCWPCWRMHDGRNDFPGPAGDDIRTRFERIETETR